MDTGKIGTSTSPQLCEPQLLIFDLNTDTLIHRYRIPRSQYSEDSLFINPVRLNTNIYCVFNILLIFSLISCCIFFSLSIVCYR